MSDVPFVRRIAGVGITEVGSSLVKKNKENVRWSKIKKF
jgi:hypothetical protein